MLNGTMTAMSADDHPLTAPGIAPEASATPAPSARLPTSSAVQRSIWFLEHMQDVVAITVGLILIALAAVLLVSGMIDFANGADGKISAAAPLLLDRVLLVLILVEIVHTVVLSLRAHRLVAQPFIVVGRMVAVFVAGLIAVSIFEKGERRGGSYRVACRPARASTTAMPTIRPSLLLADRRGHEIAASQPRTTATPARATPPPGPCTASPVISSTTMTSGKIQVGSWWRKIRALALRCSAACRVGEAPGVYRLVPFGNGRTRCLVGRLLTPLVPSGCLPVLADRCYPAVPGPGYRRLVRGCSPDGHGKSCDGPVELPLSWHHRRPLYRASRTSTAGRRPPAGWR